MSKKRVLRRRRTALVMAIGLVLLGVTSAIQAATINYGDFPGDTVTYLQVRESPSDPATASYGAPDPDPILADSLAFRPLDFEASSTGGSPGAAMSDGQLITTIMTLPGVLGIDSIHFRESGDYFLQGLTGTLAEAHAALMVEIKVLEVDHVLLPVPEFFSQSLGMDFMRPDDAQGNWNMEFDFDVVSLLAGRGITAGRATMINVTLDNALAALSQDSSTATISKKDFLIRTVTSVPEPSSGVLILLGALCFGLARRRRPG